MPISFLNSVGIVHQVGRLKHRGVRHVFAEEQRVGELDDRRALAHHFADIGLRAELVGGENRHVDAAVGAFLQAVGQGSHRGMRGVGCGQRMAEPEFELRRAAPVQSRMKRSNCPRQAEAQGESARSRLP